MREVTELERHAVHYLCVCTHAILNLHCMLTTVFGLSKLYKLEGDISRIARLGSGSACRSVLGGFVKWERGERDDGNDSLAVQVIL